MDDKTTLGVDDGDAAAAVHQRKEPRDSMFLQAMVSLDGGAALSLRVRNLSAGGMMVDCVQDCAKGEPVVTELRGIGHVRGRIAWRASGRIGIAFDDPVDPRLARMPVAGTARVQDMNVATIQRMRRPGVRTSG